MHKLILFDIGHVLVELTGTPLIRRFSDADLSDEHIHSSWTSIPGVRGFETGMCGAKEFATSVIDFYDLSCTPEEFAFHFRNAAERKFDGVDLFLDRLAATHDLACLTNTNPLQWPRISDEFGLGAYFSRQYVSYQLGVMKPEIAIYEHVVADTSLSASEILFIDDNASNCSAARSIGIDTCHVSSFEDTQQQVLARLGLSNS